MLPERPARPPRLPAVFSLVKPSIDPADGIAAVGALPMVPMHVPMAVPEAIGRQLGAHAEPPTPSLLPRTSWLIGVTWREALS